MTTLFFFLCIIALAAYTFVTGFHDASNAVAIPVRNRALTPRAAIRTSALLNFLGVAVSALFLVSIIDRWIAIPEDNTGLAMLFTALVAQVAWGLLTWWLRMPSSSTHALIGGILGAFWAGNTVGLNPPAPFTEPIFAFLVLPLLIIPLIAFGASWLLVIPAQWLIRRAYPRTVNKVSRNILSLTNSFISFGHGLQIGQRVLALFVLISLSAGLSLNQGVVALSILGFGVLLGIGTLGGGWRISHTISHKLVRVDPFRGAISQIVSALALLLTPITLNAPVSSSHLTASSVLGAGINQRFSAVRLSPLIKMLLTWLLTIPASFVIAAILMLALSPLFT